MYKPADGGGVAPPADDAAVVAADVGTTAQSTIRSTHTVLQ